jgi:hypothetical protein
MSLLHDMVVEVVRCREERGEPVCIRINPITKHALESEMRARSSFNNANSLKNAREMVINRLHEVDEKGRAVPGGWEIPIEGDDHVPMKAFWIGTGGYDVSPAQLGRKIPRSFLEFPGRN